MLLTRLASRHSHQPTTTTALGISAGQVLSDELNVPQVVHGQGYSAEAIVSKVRPFVHGTPGILHSHKLKGQVVHRSVDKAGRVRLLVERKHLIYVS
ncbi:hypothetical protein FQZ97_1220300 [compost metagenome]